MSRLMIAALAATACLSWSGAHAQVTTKTFTLKPEVKFLNCFVANVAKPPTATVTVSRAGQRDHLILDVNGLKPGLRFDVFTVQRSNLRADGSVDPAFTNFGLAWYQSRPDRRREWQGDDVAVLDHHRPNLRFRSRCGPAAD
jgi:hypothetical protein